MRRTLLFCASIAFAIACGESVTEPMPDRTKALTPPVSFATTTTEDGLSISTDKDDYQPGDTVHFTGSGWPANDVLDIKLDDEPATHDPHLWTIQVGPDGMFHDSTYVVDVGDLGVTFTLTATSQATGQSLTVIFTDGNLQLQPNPTPDPFSPNADAVKDATTIAYRNQGNPAETGVAISIRPAGAGTGGAPLRQFTIGNLAMNQAGFTVWDGRNSATPAVVVPEGEYSIRIFNATQTEASAAGQRLYNALVDITSPVISSPAVSPTPISEGSNTAVTVSGTATDNTVSGVATARYTPVSAEYNIDGGAFNAMILAPASAANAKALSATIPGTTIQGLSAGSHPVCIRATDNAGNRSANNATGNTNCATLEVTASAVGTTTEVASSLNPSIFGQSVTFTATVKTGADPVTVGNVEFIEGGTCAAPTTTHHAAAVDGSGQVSFSISSLAIGSHTIVACYLGTPAFTTSDGSVIQAVKTNVTSTAVTSSTSGNSVFGEAVTFTATVTTGSPAEAVAVGSIAFIEGGTCGSPGTTHQAATAVNGSGQASFTTSALSVATHTIVGCYSGSPGPYAASEGSVSQIVSRAVTTTSVSSSSAGNTSVFGEPVTFEATVAVSAPGSGTPTGTVTFIEGGTCAEPATILSGPTALSTLKASFETSLLSVTSHTIVACYSGDGNFTDSNGSTTQTVNKALTTTTITSTSPSGSQFVNGQVTINFAVAVTAPGSGTPTGTVGVKNGSDVLCSAALPATSCQFTPTTVALLSLVASYSGDGNFFGSSSTPAVAYTVKYNLGTGLFAPVDRPNTLNVSKAGQAIPLKWRLTDAAGAPITNLTAVNVKASSLACIGGSTTDMIEEYASGSSGLQNLGDGYYQFNWKTPPSYATLCKSIALDFISYVEGPLANFQFKK